MGDLIHIDSFSRKRLREKLSVSYQSVWVWFLNKFHVHEFIDTEVLRVTDPSSGDLKGCLYVQKCTKCGARVSQKLNAYEMDKRKGI